MYIQIIKFDSWVPYGKFWLENKLSCHFLAPGKLSQVLLKVVLLARRLHPIIGSKHRSYRSSLLTVQCPSLVPRRSDCFSCAKYCCVYDAGCRARHATVFRARKAIRAPGDEAVHRCKIIYPLQSTLSESTLAMCLYPKMQSKHNDVQTFLSAT